MNIDHGKKTWSGPELDELRAVMRETMASAQITQAQIAREAGVAAATLSQFLSGAYAGDNQRIAAQLARWLDARNREEQVLQAAPPRPTFVMTPSARKVMSALQHAQVLNDMAIVVGAAGVGKTAAATQYAATTPRVTLITASPAVRTVAAILAAILEQLSTRLPSARGRYDRTNMVRQHFGEGSLLVVDEAQRCDYDALEELRAIHDATGCGLVLMGNAAVLSRIEGAARDPAYAQLFGRAGWRVKIDLTDQADVAPVLETMGITAPEVVEFCHVIARQDGLRIVVKTVRAALMLSRSVRENLSPNHLAAAYRQLGATARAAA